MREITEAHIRPYSYHRCFWTISSAVHFEAQRLFYWQYSLGNKWNHQPRRRR